MVGRSVMRGLAIAALAAGTLAPSAWGARSYSDRPDDIVGKQLHLFYVVPSDGVDRALDTNGTVANEAASFQGWLEGQTGGRSLRLDTAGGVADVTFMRLSRTDAQIAATGAYVRDAIENELQAAGFNAPGKIYAVWYDGSSTYACGGGAWPPVKPGNVAAMYLKGAVPGYTPCGNNPFAAAGGGAPRYLQYAMLHEILHTMGIVPTCAPNHTLSGHTSDSPNDLMYAGSQPWTPSVLDVGRNDYYQAGLTACQDLSTNGWLTGTVVPALPVFSASPTAVTFADQRVGTTSASRTVTVKNTGTAPLSIDAVTIAGTNAGDFAITANGCLAADLAPAASCTVRVVFAPKASGTRVATLRFTDDAAGSPHSVSLSGQGARARR